MGLFFLIVVLFIPRVFITVLFPCRLEQRVMVFLQPAASSAPPQVYYISFTISIISIIITINVYVYLLFYYQPIARILWDTIVSIPIRYFPFLKVLFCIFAWQVLFSFRICWVPTAPPHPPPQVTDFLFMVQKDVYIVDPIFTSSVTWISSNQILFIATLIFFRLPFGYLLITFWLLLCFRHSLDDVGVRDSGCFGCGGNLLVYPHLRRLDAGTRR